MKEVEYWKNLILKIYDRVEHDKLLYGDSYVEMEYDDNKLLKSIKFNSEQMLDKISKEILKGAKHK